MNLNKGVIPASIISLALLAGAATLYPLTAQSAQRCPNMIAARRALLNARTALNNAEHDHDGHREKAVNDVNDAINQVNAALNGGVCQ